LYGRTAPELPPYIKVDNEEEYKLKEILAIKYWYSTLQYCVKYKRYLAERGEWLLAENLNHAQDIINEFHLSHPN
jgi:hypothetical protein